MPTNLTLKNIPDEVYNRLKIAAGMHRRSLNSEAIVCLEAALVPGRVKPSERLASNPLFPDREISLAHRPDVTDSFPNGKLSKP